MWRMRIFVACVFLAAGWASPALSQDSFLNGGDLLAECTRGNETFCFGYIVGVTDGISTTDRLKAPPVRRGAGDTLVRPPVDFTFCIVEGTSMAQLRDVVVAFLSDKQAHMRRTASSLVRAAFLETYPCS
jgi:hypothetical protein